MSNADADAVADEDETQRVWMGVWRCAAGGRGEGCCAMSLKYTRGSRAARVCVCVRCAWRVAAE
jgi:hypothetical protein